MASNKTPKNRPAGNSKVERKMVGQYIIGKTIGEGTFGKVKLAIHVPTSEKVAIKVLEKKRIKQQADVRRVNREIKILKKSKHTNIIQLYEVLDTQNSIYLIMENAEGGEMFDYIVSQKHVPEFQACNFFRQVVNGVEELHRNNITHRDLKPENLLLKKSQSGWVIKIVDFGLSNTHEGGKLLSTACGSPCYAAPEMIAGKKYNGPLVDIWSLGVILFALVCGYLPFEDPNTSQLYKKILSGTYTTPKWISHDVTDLIGKILQTDCLKRFRISDIRKHKWFGSIGADNTKDLTVDAVSEPAPSSDSPIIKMMALAGHDPKLVIDGVVSSACNSLTATYYLLLQKHNRESPRTDLENNNGAGATATAIPVCAVSAPSDIPEKGTGVAAVVASIVVQEDRAGGTVHSLLQPTPQGVGAVPVGAAVPLGAIPVGGVPEVALPVGAAVPEVALPVGAVPEVALPVGAVPVAAPGTGGVPPLPSQAEPAPAPRLGLDTGLAVKAPHASRPSKLPARDGGRIKQPTDR